MARELTLKQKRFITEYLKHGNATQAAEDSGYSTRSKRNTLEVIAFENLRKPQIKQAIDKALLDSEITPEWITYQIRTIATDTNHKPGDRLRGLEDLAKLKQVAGFTPQPTSLTNIEAINISFGKPKADYIQLPE